MYFNEEKYVFKYKQYWKIKLCVERRQCYFKYFGFSVRHNSLGIFLEYPNLLLPPFSCALKMVAVCSEISVHFHQTTRFHTPKDISDPLISETNIVKPAVCYRTNWLKLFLI
jgi:hypothetical protein